MRVSVIGSGIGGLSSALVLRKACPRALVSSIKVFESQNDKCNKCCALVVRSGNADTGRAASGLRSEGYVGLRVM